MRVYLHEITEQGTELRFSRTDTWAQDAIACVDETLTPAERRASPNQVPVARPERPLEGQVTLRKVDEVVVVDGRIRTEVHLLCSRCASPFTLACKPTFQTLFCRDPAMAGIAHLDKDKQGRATGKVVGRLKGKARHAHDYEGEDQKDSDLDISYLSEDWIEISEILTEQVQLLVPFQPLCSEDCKGICPNCGADLNKGRCACAKLKKPSPFTALKNLRIPGFDPNGDPKGDQ